MKKIFAILLSALALGGCDNDGIPYVSLGGRLTALGREGLHLPDAIPGHL